MLMDKFEDVIYSLNWYPNELPKKDDTVIVRKVSIDEMGAWVDLLEYGCKRGFIPLACANKCHKIGERKIKMGKIALATVFQIDYEKNNIDLKHYTVKDENVKNAEKRFYEYKRLLKLLYQISLKYENIKYQDLIKQIVYPLHEKYGNAYKAIIKSQTQPDIINKLEIPNNIKIHIFEQIEKELNRQKIKIFGLFKANLSDSDQINLLLHNISSTYYLEKEISNDDLFSSGEKQKKGEKLSIKMIRKNLYSISIDVFDPEKGISFVNRVLTKIENELKEAGGEFELEKEPKVIKKDELDELKIEISRLSV